MKRLILVVFAFCAINCDVINKSVHRSIRIFGGKHVKEQIIVVMRNGGPKSVDHFVYLLDPNVEDFSVQFTEGNRTLNYIQTTAVPPHRLLVNLQSDMNANEVRKVKVDLLHFGQVSPVQSALIGSDHYVIYRGNLYFYSNYETSKLTSYLFAKISAQITPPPLRQLEDRIEYVFKNVNPLNYETLTVGYVDDTPFLTISSLKRVIDVSHYGKIYITDRVSVKNEGRFTAPFPHEKVRTRNWWFTRLPFCAENIRYFDELGNSSKSVLLHFNDYKMLKFQPRYPLLNGWKTTYTIKYGVPAFHYLSHDRNRYSLQMRAVDHIFEDVVVEEAYVVVVLPQGASDINVTLPDRFQRSNETVSKFGRAEVRFVGKNIFEYLEDFDIRYLWSKYHLFKTPFVIIFYLECIFLAIIVIVHGKFVI